MEASPTWTVGMGRLHHAGARMKSAPLVGSWSRGGPWLWESFAAVSRYVRRGTMPRPSELGKSAPRRGARMASNGMGRRRFVRMSAGTLIAGSASDLLLGCAGAQPGLEGQVGGIGYVARFA